MASLEEQIEATRHTLETLEEAKFKRDEELQKLINTNQKYNMQEVILTKILKTLNNFEIRLESLENKINDEHLMYTGIVNKNNLSEPDSDIDLDDFNDQTSLTSSEEQELDDNNNNINNLVTYEDKEKHKESLLKSIHSIKDYLKEKHIIDLGSSIVNTINSLTPPSSLSSSPSSSRSVTPVTSLPVNIPSPSSSRSVSPVTSQPVNIPSPSSSRSTFPVSYPNGFVEQQISSLSSNLTPTSPRSTSSENELENNNSFFNKAFWS
jgi:hypothetical protein